MRRALCDSIPNIAHAQIELPENEAKHLTSVLRLKTGDEIELLDGKGNRARALLILKEKRAIAELISAPFQDAKLNSLPIDLYLSMIKGEAMEWTIEKATELGVRSIIPVETEFTVVRIQKKGADAFQERWQKIADQSLKQCGRLERLTVEAPISFEDTLLKASPLIWLDERLADHAPEAEHLSPLLSQPQISSLKKFNLLVGPEGGFSSAERNRLLQLTTGANRAILRTHLGSIILRAETAALLGISLIAGHIYGKGKN